MTSQAIAGSARRTGSSYIGRPCGVWGHHGLETDPMHHEREMMKTIVRGTTFRPGVTLSDPEQSPIERPTLLLFGSADPVGSGAVWGRVMGALPRGELMVLERAGHMASLDDPAGVGRRMEAVLR